MKTVKELIEELSRFPEAATCFAVETEVIGLVIEYEGMEGFIHCSDGDDSEKKNKALRPGISRS